MMRYEIKTIGIWSFTKIFFFINLAMGIVFGIFAAVLFGLFLTMASMLPPELSQLSDESGSAGFLLIFLPIFYGLTSAVIGTIMGVILAAIYNLMARAVGGIEIDLEPVQSRWPQPAPVPGPQYAQSPPPQPESPKQPDAGTSPDDTRRPDEPGSFGSQQG